VLDQGLDVVGMERVEDVEEVLPARVAALRQLVGEVGLEVRVVLHLRCQAHDAELVVLGHGGGADVPERQQLLLAPEELSKEVLRDHEVGRHVELD
jgi:hypothetical protein